LRSAFWVRWTVVSLGGVEVDPLAPMAPLLLPDAPELVLPLAAAPESGVVPGLAGAAPVVPLVPGLAGLAPIAPLDPELPAAAPDVPLDPELPGAVLGVPLVPGLAEPAPVVPGVPLAPGVPVEPMGVDCVLCWPAPVAGFFESDVGGVLCASAVPAIATAARPASTPLNGVDAVISETP
jgi:hypothetical protein